MTTANGTINQVAQRQPAGAFNTGALVGFRLFQALGWRLGAGAVGFTALPLVGSGAFFLSFVDHCVEVTKAGRDGSYTLCTNYSGEHLTGWLALVFGALCLVAAVGLWKRGGAVRDVEILAEQVEGQ